MFIHVYNPGFHPGLWTLTLTGSRWPDHPSVATSLNNLAGLYYTQGKYAEAKLLYKRSLAIFEKVLGPKHPNTMTVKENYAVVLRKLNRTVEAEKLDAQAKAGRGN